MKDIITLLKPRYWAFRKGIFGKKADNRIRLFLMGTIGLLFWGGTFTVFYRILRYFQGVAGFGDILAYKLLSMALVTFFVLLIFSGIITSLAKFYLSHDLLLIHSLPVLSADIFLARFVESTIDSSWMVLVYSLPVFLSYGIVFKAGLFYYVLVILAFLPLCLIASALSCGCAMLIALIMPAGRIRSVFIFLGLILFLLLTVSFRLMRPEQLVNPEAFSSLLLYFRSLSVPASPFLPTTWIYDSLHAGLQGASRAALFHLSLAWSFAALIIYGDYLIAERWYFRGFSQALTAPQPLFPFRRTGRNPGPSFFLHLLSQPARALLGKEIRTFFRDQTQWPQLFLLTALIAIYVYNFSVLPLTQSPVKTIYLQNILAFLNMGLAAFVLTAIAARFVFPAVSQEGEAFWIIKSSPLSLKTFLWIKFFVYTVPLLVMAEFLIIATNILLHVTPFMMGLSVVTIFFMVPGIVSLGMGIGAIYPDFKSENPAQAATSFGGLLFMLCSAGFIGLIIVLEAGPVYTLFMAGFHGTAMTSFQWFRLYGSFFLTSLICLLTILLPMRHGIRNLEGK